MENLGNGMVVKTFQEHRKFSLVFLSVLVLVLLVPTAILASPDGVIIQEVNSTHSIGVYTPQQRRVFQTDARIFVFFYHVGNLEYSSSIDGVTWASNVTIKAIQSGESFGIWFDGTYIHYVTSTPSSLATHMKYRRGTPNSDGSISWSAAEQDAKGSNDTRYLQKPSIITDSSGNPCIAYIVATSAAGAASRPWVTKSSTSNGTWTTASGFPYNVKSDGGGAYCVLIPLNGERLYAYIPSQGRLYTGSWSSLEDIPQAVSFDWYGSGVGIGDDVHVTWTESDGKYYYSTRAYGGGWAASKTHIGTGSAACTGVVLMKDGNGYLYAAWQNAVAKIIYRSDYVGGSWDISNVWETETEALSLPDAPGGCYSDDSRERIGVIYSTLGTPPCNLRWISYDLPETSQTLGIPSPIQNLVKGGLTAVWIGVVIILILMLASLHTPLVVMVIFAGIMTILGSTGVQMLVNSVSNW